MATTTRPPDATPVLSAAQLARRLIEIPNLLSLVRLPLAALVWLRPGDPVWIVVLLALAAISDGLDGLVARRFYGARRPGGADTTARPRVNPFRRARVPAAEPALGGSGAAAPAKRGTHDVGAWLDPVCDKVFVLSACIAVVVAWQPPWHVLLLVLVRDIATLVLVPIFRVVAGQGAFHSHDFRAVKTGKATTVAQFATMLSIMFWPAATLPFAVLSAVLGTVAIVVAVRRARATVHAHRAVGSSSPVPMGPSAGMNGKEPHPSATAAAMLRS